MKRLARIDRALLFLLTPLWLLAVVLHLDRQIAEKPLAWVPLYVEPAELPIVTGWWPETPAGERVLEPGDRILKIAGEPVGSVGRFALWARLYEAASTDLRVPVEFERNGQRGDASLALRSMPYPWQTVPLSLALGLSALLALARGRGSRAARAYATGAIAYSLQWSFCFGGAPWTTHAGLALFFAAGAFYQPLTLRAALLFPEQVAVRSRLPYALCWGFAITSFGLWLWLFGSPLPGAIGLRILGLSYGLWIAVFLGVLAWNYRRADGRGRRQLKWVLYGFYVGLGPVLLGSVIFGARPELRGLYELSLVSTVLIPPCIYVAFLAFNLYDVDRLITTTVAYSIVAPAALFLVMRAGVPLTAWTSDATGLGPGAARGLVAVLVAAPVPLLAAALRPQLERILFREHFRFERGVRVLRSELAGQAGPGALLALLGRRLEGLLALESFALYARTGSAFVPVHGAGPILPPPLPADGAFAALLSTSRAPVDGTRLRRWLRSRTLADSERGALESLGCEALVAIRRGPDLAAFLSLGDKRSGDVFTRADLALLDGVAERASLELLRFEKHRLYDEQRDLYEKLVPYAPGNFREELSRGGDVAPGEREVSVLFVMLRGYGGFFEAREAPEVFGVVSRYTAALSNLIRDHGGSVVEFHGEGLMAAFGAPAPLAGKERSAVEAARAAVKLVESEALRAPSEPRLEVGVGVATGEAFVGNIQAVDRKIWCVIGNTTNLAARLQAQTPSLGASIVLDAVSRERAGASAADFVAHAGIRLKGRDEDFTVYALPRA
jgi:class 3 adenylate cyclase